MKAKLCGRRVTLSAVAITMLSTSALAEGKLRFHGDASRTLQVASPALYPEGIEYNAKTDEFLLGSVRKGKVIAISNNRTVRTVVDDERLTSVIGIRVDAARKRLLVTNSDYGVAERSVEARKFATSALGIYDLDTGKVIHYVDLSGLRATEKRFLNDLAVDADGNAYVTDSLAAAIYKVTLDGAASIFLANERFRGQGFNLNGIQYHKDGFLLVAKKSDGSFFKVPLANPEAFTEVKLPKPLAGTDGLVLASPTELVALTNTTASVNSNTIYKLVSGDGWQTARIDGEFATGDVYATTGTIKDGKLFVSYGRLNGLPATLKDSKPLIESFQIVEIGAK